MPYNTRRKSLSLSELGIIVPKRSRTASHPSPPNTIIEGEEPPVKKSKRLHSSSSPPPPGLMSPPRTTTIRFKEEKPKQAVELSPPPSPAAEGSNKVDVEGISDDIVVGTIQQIERTGNRPHLVKELAHVLASSLHAVEKSANPCALISSRLTAYLNRSWPAISPCPLAKDLSAVHPRRLFFYLTTTTHQPIPEVAEPFMPPKRTLSPPQSSASAADEEDDRYNRLRTALSPSPEVDLSSPELEHDSTAQPPTPGAPFSGRNSLARDSRSSSLSHPKRAASPQLEREERDFRQTANQLYEQAQLRRNSSQQDSKPEQADTTAGADRDEESSVSMSIEETEEHAALRHHDDAAALFGQHAELLKVPSSAVPLLMDFSSPMMQPLSEVHLDAVPSSSPMKADMVVVERTERMSLDSGASLPVLDTTGFAAWEGLRSPEMVGVAELEDLFGDY
ncbi:hypothetical protein LTR91_009134 [Friedmanniomyces endolithicus]|uniref:GDS1 winged helix domain-containing protein n=1 Tax=Friedmanniomyces endolithicus TaxID=329885 RepID=A0AAN6FDA4_9PEZI|nr:hypothetical protein LTS09_007034 [Friedmanniomyces endolithicus]KAK0286426.1 hypothetical protein LTR35_004861 [Friedmanniomyces endolithicus]KAK0310895.1 hypothetical protein LTR82_014642 [Friedmanniomyces endolithicus]KAK0918143.1 hypothetical protein LTR57_011977 [Friedmanniomyces endolithicus]KAK0989868.1 hypothetical protein LTR91_009134 [Friedmanniomyces endolithicus]